MEIKIKQPIALRLEVFETDNRVPSMHVNVQIVVSQFQHTCRYDGTFWIECASWDEFTDSLRASSLQEAILQDMSGNFMLVVRRTDEALKLIWKFIKVDIDSSRQINVSFSSEIDDDVFGKIKSEFLNFLTWW